MKISTFYENEYLQSANYVSFRCIANYIDGFKNGARKIIYTVDKFNINTNIKVSQLSSKVAEATSFLHGEGSLYSAIVGLAQTFSGSNNVNILLPEGNFGNRFIQEASAGRYIYTRKAKQFDYILRKEDKDILIPQTFEGEEIESKFYVPIIPLLLVNGSEGIGNGFAQKILQRDEKEVIKVIEAVLSGKKMSAIKPHVRGYKGSIAVDAEGKVEITGKIDVIGANTLKITEVPFTYNLQSYLSVLNELEEKKIIKGFTDLSENDNFEFDINCTREFAQAPNEELINIFRLTKKVTENFTCIDENNAIVEFNNEKELLSAYIKIRLEYYALRKKNILKKIEYDNEVLKNKLLFVEAVINKKIEVSNKSKTDIEKQISKLKIKKIEDGYDYLLRMAIYSLSKDKFQELKMDLDSNLKRYEELKNKTEKDLWLSDLHELKSIL
jgi:DNA topoisomerase-2